MLLTYLMFFVALCLSSVAAFYSIIGLTAIFAAAVIPIVIMGSMLEVAKLVVTVWLHEYWDQCKLAMKMYLVPAVVILMLITSMGIFGFLSKAHLDQAVPVGDVTAKLAIYDEKIRTAKENIDANRRQLKQMDEAVDQILGRSTTETGAERSVQIRRQQGPERQRLIREIETEQKKISALNEERAPIAAEVRKVEAEVGPIKYIAALVYGDNPDANLLERAVRWVIIVLVFVFDPLAVMMLLAATESLAWERQKKKQSGIMADDSAAMNIDPEPPGVVIRSWTPEEIAELNKDSSSPGWMFGDVSKPYPSTEEEVEELRQERTRIRQLVDQPSVTEVDDVEDPLEDQSTKLARAQWKKDNPGKTLKEQRNLFEKGMIDRLPWEDYLDRHKSSTRLGRALPGLSSEYSRGDLFVLTGVQPTQLYKFTGDEWIMIDKSTTDQYTHDAMYIDYLIDAVSKGQYDPELLTDLERIEIENKLKNSTQNG